MARIDWSMSNTVKPEDMNQIGREINEALATARAAETPEGAQAKVDALAGQGNTKTVKQLDDEMQEVAANQGVISDTITGKKYKFGIENGLVFLEVVGG